MQKGKEKKNETKNQNKNGRIIPEVFYVIKKFLQ